MVVILEGTASPEMREVPDIDGDGIDDMADCFDVDLVDAKTKRVIGTASECLAFGDLDDQGAKPVATTTFNFRHGTLVQRGNSQFSLYSGSRASIRMSIPTSR